MSTEPGQDHPYKVHTVLTDNSLLRTRSGGTHFTTPGNVCSMAAEIREGWAKGEVFRCHAFEAACTRADIDHRLTKPGTPEPTDRWNACTAR